MSTTQSNLVLALAGLVVLTSLGGCGDDGEATPDTGIDVPDASTPDAGPTMTTSSCAAPIEVVGTIGTVSVVGDTTDGLDGPLDLGQCGNFEVTPRAPQDVIAYTVPGTGPVGVTFTTVTDETLTNFDTVVQVRRGCSTIPEETFPPSCFDDETRTDPRSGGTLSATGGDIVYFIVTGYTDTPLTDTIDRGPYSIEITARANAIPELTGGEVRAIGDRTEIEATAIDEDRDGYGVIATFLDGAGAPVDLDGDGTAEDTLFMLFNGPVTAGSPWTGMTTVFAIRFGDAAALLADRLRALGAATATLQVFDEHWAVSGELTVPVRFIDEVGLGATCDDTHACVMGLRCAASVCEPTPAVAGACVAAIPLAVDTPTTATTSVTQTGTLAEGDGLFEASCAHTPGTESVYSVAVPSGSYDLLATTDFDGTGETDTVLYLRSVCADLLTEVAGGCSDDITSGGVNVRSALELRDVAEGTYTLFVENFGHVMDGPVPYELRVSLRPVLATGASCDPAGRNDRCAAGACAPGTSTCP